MGLTPCGSSISTGSRRPDASACGFLKCRSCSTRSGIILKYYRRIKRARFSTRYAFVKRYSLDDWDRMGEIIRLIVRGQTYIDPEMRVEMDLLKERSEDSPLRLMENDDQRKVLALLAMGSATTRSPMPDVTQDTLGRRRSKADLRPAESQQRRQRRQPAHSRGAVSTKTGCCAGKLRTTAGSRCWPRTATAIGVSSSRSSAKSARPRRMPR